MKKHTRTEQRVQRAAKALSEQIVEVLLSDREITDAEWPWVTRAEHALSLVWQLLQQPDHDGRSNPDVYAICRRYFELKEQGVKPRPVLLQRIANEFGVELESIGHIIDRSKYKQTREHARFHVNLGTRHIEGGVTTFVLADGTVLQYEEGVERYCRLIEEYRSEKRHRRGMVPK